MLEPLDRFSRDSTLFQFTSKRLRAFIDPKHLLIQIDEWVTAGGGSGPKARSGIRQQTMGRSSE